MGGPLRGDPRGRWGGGLHALAAANVVDCRSPLAQEHEHPQPMARPRATTTDHDADWQGNTATPAAAGFLQAGLERVICGEGIRKQLAELHRQQDSQLQTGSWLFLREGSEFGKKKKEYSVTSGSRQFSFVRLGAAGVAFGRSTSCNIHRDRSKEQPLFVSHVANQHNPPG